MGMVRLLWLALLAGCPAAPRYIVADVYGSAGPLQSALVASHCAGARANSAARTDEDGRARLAVRHEVAQCGLLVAKPGYTTVEITGVHACSKPSSCPPVPVQLEESAP
jgi:hypothetical protein